MPVLYAFGRNNDHIFIDFIWSMQRLFCEKISDRMYNVFFWDLREA